ncbi:hypothetical protein F4811DRAFT_547717 [Daldinia bambusicola]|nr:hypothetical protein F4811DRAFT_547717 [Daldinia bambusicola]
MPHDTREVLTKEEELRREKIKEEVEKARPGFGSFMEERIGKLEAAVAKQLLREKSEPFVSAKHFYWAVDHLASFWLLGAKATEKFPWRRPDLYGKPYSTVYLKAFFEEKAKQAEGKAKVEPEAQDVKGKGKAEEGEGGSSALRQKLAEEMEGESAEVERLLEWQAQHAMERGKAVAAERVDKKEKVADKISELLSMVKDPDSLSPMGVDEEMRRLLVQPSAERVLGEALDEILSHSDYQLKEKMAEVKKVFADPHSPWETILPREIRHRIAVNALTDFPWA